MLALALCDGGPGTFTHFSGLFDITDDNQVNFPSVGSIKFILSYVQRFSVYWTQQLFISEDFRVVNPVKPAGSCANLIHGCFMWLCVIVSVWKAEIVGALLSSGGNIRLFFIWGWTCFGSCYYHWIWLTFSRLPFHLIPAILDTSPLKKGVYCEV